MLSPFEAYEIGETNDYPGLTPNVVFVEGMKSLGNDKFLLFYGAADSTIGCATI